MFLMLILWEKSRVAVYPHLSQDEVYFLRCGKEACGHSLSTVARYGMVTPCVWKQKRGGNLPPCFFFFRLKGSLLILKSTDAFCDLKVQNIRIILKCSGERAFSFEFTRTSGLHDPSATDLVGSLFCYDSVNTRLLKHPSFCKQHSSATVEICLFRITVSVHVFNKNIEFSDVF